MAKSLTKQHSSYWLGDTTAEDLSRTGDSIADAMRLVMLKKSVANFVRIVTGESYPVVFSSGQKSYTDGKFVVLSASKSDSNFDSLVGLALHEASHLLLSDFDALKVFNEFAENIVPSEDVTLFRAKFSVAGSGMTVPYRLKNLYHTIFNVVEDRRIDYFIYRTAPGYRPYYEAMYDRYFRNPNVDKAMREHRIRQPTVDNYLFHLINMINPLFDTRVLPDLDKIYGLVSLDTLYRLDADPLYKNFAKHVRAARSAGTVVDFDKIPLIWQVVIKIARVILENSEVLDMVKDEPEDDPPGRGGQPGEDEGEGGSSGSGESDGDESDESDDGNESARSENAESENSDTSGSSSGNGNYEENYDPPEYGEGAGSGESDESDAEGNESEGDEGDEPRRERHADTDGTKRGNKKKWNESAFDKAARDQRDFLKGDVRKVKATKEMERMTDALESAGAEIQEIEHESSSYRGGRVKSQVVILHKFERSQVDYGTTPFTPDGHYRWESRGTYGRNRYRYYGSSNSTGVITNPRKGSEGDRFVAEGFRMGRVLASKLAIRNQEVVRKFNRRPDGRIDKRRLAGIGAGESSVFYHLRRTAYEPVYLHMSIDASGSMSGLKFRNSMALAIAVAVAADEIDNLDVEISLRAGTWDRHPVAIIQTVYDSRVDTPAKIRALFPYLDTMGCTPEGLCFEAISKHVIDSAEKKDAYFVNLSDGQPAFDNYSGPAAIRHTRSQMVHFRRSGIKILSYFISESERETAYAQEPFRQMYGKAASVIDPTSITAIAKTLNKLFLS